MSMTLYVRTLLDVVYIFADVKQWDLGEFDQKGTVATRWGTKDELIKACSVARENGIQVIVDVVLNVIMSRLISRMTSDLVSISSIDVAGTGERWRWRRQWIQRTGSQ